MYCAGPEYMEGLGACAIIDIILSCYSHFAEEILQRVLVKPGREDVLLFFSQSFSRSLTMPINDTTAGYRNHRIRNEVTKYVQQTTYMVCMTLHRLFNSRYILVMQRPSYVSLDRSISFFSTGVKPCLSQTLLSYLPK